jgi:hypothetical protein
MSLPFQLAFPGEEKKVEFPKDPPLTGFCESNGKTQIEKKMNYIISLIFILLKPGIKNWPGRKWNDPSILIPCLFKVT